MTSFVVTNLEEEMIFRVEAHVIMGAQNNNKNDQGGGTVDFSRSSPLSSSTNFGL